MIDQFVDEAKKEIGGKLKQRFGIEDEQVHTLFRITKSALQDQVKTNFFKGNLKEILHLFEQSQTPSSLLAETQTKISKGIHTQLALDYAHSEEMSQYILQEVISFFQAKFKASGYPSDIAGLSKFLGVGNLGNIFSIFK